MEVLKELLNGIAELNPADIETGIRPALRPGTRRRLRRGLARVLVNPVLLHAYIRELRKRLSPPFRHARLLPEELMRVVLARGLAVLGDEELAGLALNPLALCHLHDQIDEQLPAAWLAAMRRDGESLLRQHGLEIPADLIGDAADRAGLLICLEEDAAAMPAVPPAPERRWQVERPARECIGDAAIGEGTATVEIEWYMDGYLLVQPGGLLAPGANGRVDARWLAADGTVRARGTATGPPGRIRLETPDRHGPNAGDRLDLWRTDQRGEGAAARLLVEL